MNTRHGGPRAARLHGLQGWHSAAEKATRLRLPPSVHNHRLLLAYDLVVPEPHLRFDGLTHRGHVLEAVVIFRWLIWPGFAQHADRRRGRVEDIDVETLGDAPGTTSIRVGGYAFVHDTCRSERERTVHDIRVPRDPADICHAPIDILRMNVLDEFGSASDIGQISPDAVLAAFGAARGATGVHQEERCFRWHGHRSDSF